MKKRFAFMAAYISLISCSVTNPVSYTITDDIPIKTIGIARLDETSGIFKYSSGVNEIFSKEVKKEFEKQGVTTVYPLTMVSRFTSPNISETITICANNHLDAVIVTKMDAPAFKDTVMNGSSYKKLEAQLSMKLIDRNGKTTSTVVTKYNSIQPDSATYPLSKIIQQALEAPVRSMVGKIQK